jgi:hypothetical protein
MSCYLYGENLVAETETYNLSRVAASFDFNPVIADDGHTIISLKNYMADGDIYLHAWRVVPDLYTSDIETDNYIEATMGSSSYTMDRVYSNLNDMMSVDYEFSPMKGLNNMYIVTSESTPLNGTATTILTAMTGNIESVRYADTAVFDTSVADGSLVAGTNGTYDTLITFERKITSASATSLTIKQYSLYVNKENITSNDEGNYALYLVSINHKA